MHLKYYIVCISLLTTNKMTGQDQHFSDMNHTLNYSNPSYIAVSDDAIFSATYRNQWPGLNSAYVTYCSSIIFPVETMNSTFGINLIHDNQARGAITKTSVSALYSYTIKVSRFVNVAAGLAVAYNFRGVDASKFVYETDLTGMGTNLEPLNYTNYKSSFGDFSLGLTTIYDKKFFMGFSASHITKPIEHSSDNGFNTLSRRYVLHAGGIIPLTRSRRNENISLFPGAMFQQQDRFQELFYGANCLIPPFSIGLWLRQDLKFYYDAMIFLTGFSWKMYNFYYSYDVNLKKINFFSTGMGAHEVTFSVNFQYNEKRKKRGAIKCPKI